MVGRGAAAACFGGRRCCKVWLINLRHCSLMFMSNGRSDIASSRNTLAQLADVLYNNTTPDIGSSEHKLEPSLCADESCACMLQLFSEALEALLLGDPAQPVLRPLLCDVDADVRTVRLALVHVRTSSASVYAPMIIRNIFQVCTVLANLSAQRQAEVLVPCCRLFLDSLVTTYREVWTRRIYLT